MAPPKAACEAYITTKITWAKLVGAYYDAIAAIKKINALKFKLKWGDIGNDILTGLASLGEMILNQIETLAASMADNLLGEVSSAGSKILESILGALLKIVLLFPTALFELVAIPYQRAVHYCERERFFLSKCFAYFEDINSIVLKWSRHQQGTDVYNQMRKAMPYINSVLTLMEAIIQQLQGAPVSAGIQKEPFFDQEKYNKLQADLSQAINITMPSSLIENKFNLNQRLKIESDKIYNQKIIKINAEYDKQKAIIVQGYKSDVDKIKNTSSSKDTSIKGSVGVFGIKIPFSINTPNDFDKAKTRYDDKIKKLDKWKKDKIMVARIEADTYSADHGAAFEKAYNGIKAEFQYDMNRVMQDLSDFTISVQSAYTSYLKCHQACATIYNFQGLIKYLLKQLIAIIRASMGPLNKSTQAIIESAESMVSLTGDMFTKAIDKYNTGQPISGSELSITLTTGHVLLNTADTVLDTTITSSLINALNTPNNLTSIGNEYQAFLDRLAKIQDWDGAIAVWAVNIDLGSPAPYIELVPESLSMVTKIPAAIGSVTPKSRTNLSTSLSKVRKTLNKILRHNYDVYNTLNSYVPYYGSEYGNLVSLLNHLGILDEFATTMDVLAIVRKLQVDCTNHGFNNIWPTDANCLAAYPDLKKMYDSRDDVWHAIARNRASSPSPLVDSKHQADSEANAIKALGLNTQITQGTILNDVDEKGLNNPVPSP